MCDLPTGRPFSKKMDFSSGSPISSWALRLPRYDRHERFLLHRCPVNAHTIMVVAEAMRGSTPGRVWVHSPGRRGSAIHLGNHRLMGGSLLPTASRSISMRRGHDPIWPRPSASFTMSWTRSQYHRQSLSELQARL